MHLRMMAGAVVAVVGLLVAVLLAEMVAEAYLI